MFVKEIDCMRVFLLPDYHLWEDGLTARTIIKNAGNKIMDLSLNRHTVKNSEIVLALPETITGLPHFS